MAALLSRSSCSHHNHPSKAEQSLQNWCLARVARWITSQLPSKCAWELDLPSLPALPFWAEGLSQWGGMRAEKRRGGKGVCQCQIHGSRNGEDKRGRQKTGTQMDAPSHFREALTSFPIKQVLWQ